MVASNIGLNLLLSFITKVSEYLDGEEIEYKVQSLCQEEFVAWDPEE
jgi:hypothetical protein